MGHHLLGGLALHHLGGGAQNGPGVAGRQGSVLHQLQQILRQSQQTQSVGDGGAGLAHLLGHLLLGHAVLFHQHLITPGFFRRVQVFPLEVFNESQLHDLSVVCFDNDGGHFSKAGLLGGAPTPLAGDDLIVA